MARPSEHLKLVTDEWDERALDPHGDEARTLAPDAEALASATEALLESLSRHAQTTQSRVVRIRNFRSTRYRLVEDLLVTIEEEQEGTYLAWSYDTGQYGLGHSPDDAIDHLCSVLEEYYDLLDEERGSLSPSLASHLAYLDSILEANSA